MKIYKNVSIVLFIINFVCAVTFLFSMNLDLNSSSFEYVAFNFTLKQKLLSRISLSMEELLNLHILNSLQYNLLPCCLLVNALVYVIAFITNIGRWPNLIVFFFQIEVFAIIMQLSYTVTLNSNKSLMLLLISGGFTAMSALLYVITLLSFLYVKIMNPIRRGFIVIFAGILICYKNYLYDIESSALFGQMFNVIILVITAEIIIDFLNVLEKIVQHDKNNKRFESE